MNTLRRRFLGRVLAVVNGKPVTEAEVRQSAADQFEAADRGCAKPLARGRGRLTQVRVVCRQYPLASHQNAQKAAEASLCAQDQGKFWEMQDTLFADQKNLGVDQLKATAVSLGLDTKRFNKCIDFGEKNAIIQADLKDGEAAGVSSTPTIFVNGRFISGIMPIDQLSTVIDDELRHAGKKAASK